MLYLYVLSLRLGTGERHSGLDTNIILPALFKAVLRRLISDISLQYDDVWELDGRLQQILTELPRSPRLSR